MLNDAVAVPLEGYSPSGRLLPGTYAGTYFEFAHR
jgi:hypothetical protein